MMVCWMLVLVVVSRDSAVCLDLLGLTLLCGVGIICLLD